MKTTSIFLALLGSLSLLGCGPEDTGDTRGGRQETPDSGNGTAQPSPTEAEPGCASDSECGAGSGCALPGGVCVAFPTAEARFSVLVDPGEGSGLIPDQFAGLSVGAGGTVNVTLPEPLVVFGVVALQAGHGNDPVDGAPQQADEGSERVTGRLVATADGIVPGTQLRSEADVRETDDPTRMFTLKVLAGHVYDVAFIPDNPPEKPAVAPSYLSTLFTAGRFDILLPARTEYTTVTGVVARGAQNEEPVRGARVTATVAQPLSQKTVRNSAITDDEGRFSIVVTGQGAITIRVEPGKDSPLFDPKEFVTAYEGQLGDEDVVRKITDALNVGPILPVREVEVQVLDASLTAPVRTALVQVTTPGGATRTSATGKDGVARLSIPDGTYTLAVMPPAGSELAAKWVPLSVGADMQTLLPLDPRVRLSGRVVRKADDAPVANAVVTLVTNRVASLGSVSEALQDVSFDAVTEADGSFVVFVDPGRYALSIEPPPESGLGRFAHPDLALTDATAVAALQLKVPLPRGVLVHGQVFRQATDAETKTQKAVPVPGARVQFFFEVPAAMSEAVWSLRHDASFAAMLQLAGAAESDDAGRFGAVVPAIEAAPVGNGKGGGYWDGQPGMGPTPGGEPSAPTDSDAMGDCDGTDAFFGLPDLCIEPR